MNTKDLLKKAAAKTETTKASGKEKKEILPGQEVLVDQVITLKDKIEDLTAKYAVAEEQLTTDASLVYQQRAVAGDYQSSVVYAGKKTNGAMVVFSDRFSAIPAEEEANLRALDPLYDRHFEEARKLTLSKTDDATINFLVKKLGEEKFMEIFKVDVKIVAKSGIAREMHSLAPEVKNMLRQSKPGVRRVTEDGKAS